MKVKKAVEEFEKVVEGFMVDTPVLESFINFPFTAKLIRDNELYSVITFEYIDKGIADVLVLQYETIAPAFNLINDLKKY